MEKTSLSLERLQSEFISKKKQIYIPQKFLQRVRLLGLSMSLKLAINHLIYRVKCRVSYSIALLRTLQVNYQILDAGRITKWIIRLSMTSVVLSQLISWIETTFSPIKLSLSVKKQKSKKLRLSESELRQAAALQRWNEECLQISKNLNNFLNSNFS